MADATAAPVAVASFWALPLVLPPLFGLLSGYQAIHGKFPAGSRRALTKLGSWGYLLTRVVLPTVGYVIWFYGQTPNQHSWVAAVAWGLGTELVLRCRFYVGDKQSAAGQTEAVFRGMFDLVEWYQKLWLNHVGTQLATERNDFIAALVNGETDFTVVLARARDRAQGWDQAQRNTIAAKLTEIETAFASSGNGAGKEHAAFIRSLGFAMLDLVGRKGVTELLRKP